MGTNYNRVQELDMNMRKKIHGIVKEHGKIVFHDGEEAAYECCVGYADPESKTYDDVVELTYVERPQFGRVHVILNNNVTDRVRELDLGDSEFSTFDIADMLDGCIKLTQNK